MFQCSKIFLNSLTSNPFWKLYIPIQKQVTFVAKDISRKVALTDRFRKFSKDQRAKIVRKHFTFSVLKEFSECVNRKTSKCLIQNAVLESVSGSNFVLILKENIRIYQPSDPLQPFFELKFLKQAKELCEKMKLEERRKSLSLLNNTSLLQLKLEQRKLVSSDDEESVKFNLFDSKTAAASDAIVNEQKEGGAEETSNISTVTLADDSDKHSIYSDIVSCSVESVSCSSEASFNSSKGKVNKLRKNSKKKPRRRKEKQISGSNKILCSKIFTNNSAPEASQVYSVCFIVEKTIFLQLVSINGNNAVQNFLFPLLFPNWIISKGNLINDFYLEKDKLLCIHGNNNLTLWKVDLSEQKVSFVTCHKHQNLNSRLNVFGFRKGAFLLLSSGNLQSQVYFFNCFTHKYDRSRLRLKRGSLLLIKYLPLEEVLILLHEKSKTLLFFTFHSNSLKLILVITLPQEVHNIAQSFVHSSVLNIISITNIRLRVCCLCALDTPGSREVLVLDVKLEKPTEVFPHQERFRLNRKQTDKVTAGWSKLVRLRERNYCPESICIDEYFLYCATNLGELKIFDVTGTKPKLLRTFKNKLGPSLRNKVQDTEILFNFPKYISVALTLKNSKVILGLSLTSLLSATSPKNGRTKKRTPGKNRTYKPNLYVESDWSKALSLDLTDPIVHG
eukprot:snap_masked-scaffold_12-processed-gene-9.9-mRNA-1 protein AED:1.00 eAED:1.00 QI:0/-1/0/0/-1/1/1/0/672